MLLARLCQPLRILAWLDQGAIHRARASPATLTSITLTTIMPAAWAGSASVIGLLLQAGQLGRRPSRARRARACTASASRPCTKSRSLAAYAWKPAMGGISQWMCCRCGEGGGRGEQILEQVFLKMLSAVYAATCRVHDVARVKGLAEDMYKGKQIDGVEHDRTWPRSGSCCHDEEQEKTWLDA